MADSLAKIISRVFGPLTIEPVVFIFLVLFGADLSAGDRVTAGIVLVVTNLFIPGSVMAWAFLTGRITDLDITRRQERVLVFTVSMISVWLGFATILLLGISAPVFSRFVLAQAVVLAILWGITFFDKVSLHAAGIMSIVATVIVVLGFENWPLGICVPIVWWARWRLKKHTVVQLALGTLVPIVVYGLLFLTLP